MKKRDFKIAAMSGCSEIYGIQVEPRSSVHLILCTLLSLMICFIHSFGRTRCTPPGRPNSKALWDLKNVMFTTALVIEMYTQNHSTRYGALAARRATMIELFFICLKFGIA